MNKTNEQMYEELEQALWTLSEKLRDLLRYGKYQLEYLNRDFVTNEVSSASMIVGDHTLTLRSTKLYGDRPKGTQVSVMLPDNPVDDQMLEAWDSQVIEKDIAYYQTQLEKLLKRKDELTKKAKLKNFINGKSE